MSNVPHASNAPPPAAVRTFRRRLLRAAMLMAVLALLGWLARSVWTDGGDDPERLWNDARQAWSGGRWDEAESLLARLAKQRPATAAERLLRAQVARKQGRRDFALFVLEGVPDSDPEASRIWSARGLIEFEQNRGRAAEADLLRAVALNPTLAEPRQGLIDLYTIEGRPGDLAAQCRALSQAGALDFDRLYLWTLGRRQDVGPAEIAAKLEPMVGNDPTDRWARLALAENLRRLGRLDEALDALDPLPATDPLARAATVRVALDRGEVNRADALLAEGPADHPALAQLRGRLALSQGDRAAVGHYRAALAASPSDRDSLFGLGQALRLAWQARRGATLPRRRPRPRSSRLAHPERPIPRTTRRSASPPRDRRRLPVPPAARRSPGLVPSGPGPKSTRGRRSKISL